MDAVLLAGWALELSGSVVHSGVRETLSRCVSAVSLTAFHTSHVLLPFQTQICLRMEILIRHPVLVVQILHHYDLRLFFSPVLLLVVSSLSPSLAVTSRLLITDLGEKKTRRYSIEASLSSRPLGAESKSDVVREDTVL